MIIFKFNIKRIMLLYVFIVLKLFINPSASQESPADISFLKKLCGISSTTAAVTPLPPPELCTAYAMYTTNPGTQDKTAVIIPEGDIKLVLIMNDLATADFRENLKPEKVDGFIGTTVEGLPGKEKIKAIVFENLVPCPENDEAFGEDLANFFKKFKEKLPGVALGLGITVVNTKLTPESIKCIKEFVDFFVASTYNYNQCKAETDITSPLDLMTASLTDIVAAGIKVDKLIITIQIGVNIIVGGEAANPKDDISLTAFCTTAPTEKYCKDTLDSYYKKGKLIGDKTALGVLVQFIEYDDFGSKCDCKGEYPVLKVIDAGLSKSPEPQDIINCPKLKPPTG